MVTIVDAEVLVEQQWHDIGKLAADGARDGF
jgi:hypothetical protein